MNIKIRGLVPVALFAFMLTGCHQSPPPAAKPTLVALDRPLSMIKLKNNDRIIVPAANVIKRGGITGVYVLQNKMARFRMIKTGKLAVNHIEVLSGLHGSETLVGGDLSTVHDGSPINNH